MDQSPQYNKNIYYGALFLLTISLIPWFLSFINQAVNVDIAYLTSSAIRMLDGHNMVDEYYDTNPPLSIMLQSPSVFISKLFGVELYKAIISYVLFLWAGSVILTHQILKYVKDLTPYQRLTFMGAFLGINIALAGYDFGQKDHILGLYLVPLAILQLLITQKVQIKTMLKWAILIPSSVFILLKPHYGLVPASIFIYRAIKQKRLSVIIDPDFICLGLMACLYLGIVLLFFNDFVTVILPDVITFYAYKIPQELIYTGGLLAFFPVFCLLLTYIFSDNFSNTIRALFLLSGLCFIPFIMQGKGWIYHLLPAALFLAPSLGIVVNAFLEKSFSIVKDKARTTAFLVTILLLCISNLYFGSMKYGGVNGPIHLTHDSFQNSELADIINECEGECSFLILQDLLNVSQELAIYTGQPHASRFPHFWALFPRVFELMNAIHNKEPVPIKQETINQTIKKYAGLIAEDIIKYEPDVILVAHMPWTIEGKTGFNYKDFLSSHSIEFKNVWKNYDLERTINVDRIDYMVQKVPNEELMRYDIYRKRRP